MYNTPHMTYAINLNEKYISLNFNEIAAVFDCAHYNIQKMKVKGIHSASYL